MWWHRLRFKNLNEQVAAVGRSWRDCLCLQLYRLLTFKLQKPYTAGKSGLLFHTANGTPHLYGNLADRWLTPRLAKMGLKEEGMGWHSFKRFRKTWLRGQRCLEDINNFWMAHKPQTMSELYSHLNEDLQLRLDEAARVGYGFALPASNNASVVPIVPKVHQNSAVEIGA
jgi:hypothetical protein